MRNRFHFYIDIKSHIFVEIKLHNFIEMFLHNFVKIKSHNFIEIFFYYFLKIKLNIFREISIQTRLGSEDHIISMRLSQLKKFNCESNHTQPFDAEGVIIISMILFKPATQAHPCH